MIKRSELRGKIAKPREYPQVDEAGLFALLKSSAFEPMAWKEKVVYLCTYLDFLKNHFNHFNHFNPSADELFAMYRSDDFCREAKLLTGMRFDWAIHPLIANTNKCTSGGATSLYSLYESANWLPARYFLAKALLASPIQDDDVSQGLRLHFATNLAHELATGNRAHYDPEEMLTWVDASPTFEHVLLKWWEEMLGRKQYAYLYLASKFLALEQVWEKRSGRTREFLDTIQILLLGAIQRSVHNLLREEENDFDVIEESPLLVAIVLNEKDDYQEEMTGS